MRTGGTRKRWAPNRKVATGGRARSPVTPSGEVPGVPSAVPTAGRLAQDRLGQITAQKASTALAGSPAPPQSLAVAREVTHRAKLRRLLSRAAPAGGALCPARPG